MRYGFIHQATAEGDRLDDGGAGPWEGWVLGQDGGWDREADGVMEGWRSRVAPWVLWAAAHG